MAGARPLRRAVRLTTVTETRSPGWLARSLHRLTADDHSIDAEELRADAVSAGCEPVSSCRKGAVVTVTGRLKSVVYTPRETVPTLEAELFDGSGSVTLVWLGRRRIPGIEPGRTVTARGVSPRSTASGSSTTPGTSSAPADHRARPRGDAPATEEPGESGR